MSTRVVDEIDDWESEPFDGGYARLHELADEEFSGVVQSGAAKLCFLNGTAVGVLDGSVEDFEGASGTVSEAPSPALPLLALMQERGDEVRAKYYTEDTPISEVDSTLADGGFSGYIELSENVLSGDYYVVYHAGRSMAVAYVGNSGQLLTDDEAFERADGEVGIYEVRPVDVDPVEIPEPEGTASAAGAGTTGGSAAGAAAGAAATADDADGTDDTAAGSPESTGADAQPSDSAASPEGADAAGSADAADTAPAAEGADAGASGSAGATDAGTVESRETDVASGGTEAASGAEDRDAMSGGRDTSSSRETDAGEADSEPVDTGDTGTDAGADRTGSDRGQSGRESGAGVSRAGGESTAGADPDRAGRSQPRGGADAGESASSSHSPGGSDDPGRPAGGAERSSQPDRGSGSRPAGGRAPQDRSADVAAPDRLETRSIPSLDPARTTDQSGGAGGAVAGQSGQRPSQSPRSQSGRDASTGVAGGARDQSQAGRSRSQPPSQSRQPGARESATDDAPDGSGGTAGGGVSQPDRERVAELESELEDTRGELERVESTLADAEAERDELRAERDELRERVDQLESERDALAEERDDLEADLADRESEIERLRSQLEQLEEQLGAATDAERRLSPAEALDGTNLFVRYESKGEGTLESAHDGNASREAVNGNLDLEHHTQFEADNASVAGDPFDEFLRGTIQYRFVAWVVYDLLYEIRDTGKVQALEELYDAIPRVDRAELNGSISATFTEDGQEKRTQESFDVVLRDRMGNALVVANFNDSREAATESMMNSLVTAASNVGASDESLAAACLVTSSFFEPEALEAAADATGGGLLSRDKRQSYVKLSRKRGYHLCLAEAREGKFHLAVPEL